MSALMRRLPLSARSGLAALVCLTVSNSLACSCTKSDDQPQPDPEQHETEWAIHVYVGDGADRKRVDFAPVLELSTPAEAAETSGLSTKSTVETPDGAVTLPTESSATSPYGVSGWGLLWGAAQECDVVRSSVPPWSAQGSWYVLPGTPKSCNSNLIAEQQLLCIADKLKQISDAVAPIRWEKTGSDNAPVAGVPQGPWTIPVQSEKDKFIARDLAIHTLAHLARLDARVPDGDTLSCSRAFEASADGAYDPTRATALFGAADGSSSSAALPPVLTINSANHRALALARLSIETHVLIGGERMLYDLIRESVFADTAGAASRSGRVIDRLKGSRIAWGQADTQNGPYNSFAHAIRVLTGRWEIGGKSATGADPTCGGVRALDILNGAYGSDLSARVEDVPIATAPQAKAVQVVETAGLVFPSAALTADSGTLKKALKDQLLVEAAKPQGIDITAADLEQRLGDQGKAIAASVDAIADADLRFALERSLRTFRLLSNAPSTTPAMTTATDTTPVAGLFAKSVVAASVKALGGNAFDKGIARNRVARDAIARSGGLLETSQCNPTAAITGAGTITLGADTPMTATLWPSGIAEIDKFDRTTFQDSFAVAQTFQKRISVIGAALSPGGGSAPADADPTLQKARAGIAELRTWAGPARVYSAFRRVGTTSTWSDFQIVVTGALPEDLGFSTEAEALQRFSIVYGPAWTAECAARLRDTCPATIPRIRPTSVTKTTADSAATLASGVTGDTYVLNFNANSELGGAFRGTITPDEHYYLILESSPATPGTAGLVLGNPVPRLPTTASPAPLTSFAFSRMQRELLNVVLGFDDKKTGYPATVGETSAAVGPDFCVDGLRRDLFVPLENELTSDSDPYENSWKHYLTLAKSAADRADSLGQQLVNIGYQKDLRRETAADQLADLCGDATAIDKITIGSDGKVSPPSSSDPLSECLGEDKTDIVFLTDDPTAGLDAAAKKAKLREVLDCPGAVGGSGSGATNPLCTKLEAWDGKDPNGFKTAGLGIAPSEPTPAASTCNGLGESSRSLFSKFNAAPASATLSEPWADVSALQAISHSLALSIDSKDEWTVTAAGSVVMSTTDSTKWPACLRAAGTATTPSCSFADNATIKAFNDAFRGCDSPDREGKALGGCDASFFSGDAERTELNALRWRVEGAIWLLQSASGRVREGSFAVQIPVTSGVGNTAVHLTKWGDGFTEIADRPGFFRLNASATATAEDSARSVTANVQALDSAFTLLPDSREFPSWYETIYTAGSGYKHAAAKNGDFTSNFGTVKAYLAARGVSAPGLDDAAAPGFDRAGWGKLLSLAIGTKCDKADREEASTPGAKRELIGLVAALKRNVNLPIDPSPIRKHRVMVWKDGTFQQEFRTARGVDYSGEADDYGGTADETSGGFVDDEAHWCQDVALVSGRPWKDDGVSPFTHEGPTTDFATPPTKYDLGNRVAEFVNSGAPCQSCSATRQALQALTIGCIAQRGLIVGDIFPETPKLEKPEDIVKLETWLEGLQKRAREQMSRLYIERVPDRVIQDFHKSAVASGSKLGTHGDKVVEMTTALESLPLAWQAVATDLGQAENAIRGARIKLSGIDIHDKQTLIDLEIRELKVYGQMIDAVANHISSFSGAATPFGWFAVAGTGVAATGTIALGADELGKLDDLKGLAGDETANQVSAAMQELRTNMSPVWFQMQTALGNVRTATSSLQIASSDLDRLEKKAQAAAANGAGKDYYEVDGQAVPIPVNTVLNRQYDGLGIRYKRALEDAKRLAYIARRAIEQRIGVGLTEIDHKVGPMDAPVTWADRICRLQGIDYTRLRLDTGVSAVDDAGSPLAPQTAAEFADAFVGDYVEMLGNFVEYYNLEYPSHDGDDTAILSLKNDLLTPVSSCMADGPNLLHYSGRLYDVVDPSVGPSNSDSRWRYHACPDTAATCVQAFAGDVLLAPDPANPGKSLPLAPPDAPNGAISWLVDQPVAGGISGKGTLDGPPGLLSQSVTLEPGDYLISWWDQSRAPDGTYPTSASKPYSVAVMTTAWTAIASATPTPFTPSADGKSLWSERHSLAFSVKAHGTYYIAFGASAGSDPGSVAIANVQLESIVPGGQAGPYCATGASRRIVTSVCADRSSSDLRAAFVRKCDGSTDCYYELQSPILIETATLKDPASMLAGKLARGNFNYRHIDVALNLVGTGVRDCTSSPTASCYGSGFTEYTLLHDGTRAPITDWDGITRPFDFSIARIEHGKALSAERFITMPLGSADSALLAQPGITKMELRGRPLDGNYRLQIWDSPALRWDRLDDIQLVLKYRYWSRVDRQAKSP